MPTTGTSRPRAITRCCFSIGRATVWRRSCGRATSTAAEDWNEVLLPEIARQQKQSTDVVVRADAAFAKPELYETLEKRGVKYAIRIPSNDILEQEVAELLTRSVGRPSHTPVVRHTSFRYQAASWTTARRVVAKIEFHYGELFPRVGFIVTTLEADNRAVVRFYRAPGQIWRVQRVRFPPRQGPATHREPSLGLMEVTT